MRLLGKVPSMKILPGIVLLVASGQVRSQKNGISGRIVDSESGNALAFVSIVYNSHGNGLVSNFDGKFDIVGSTMIEFLEFSHLGYKDKKLEKGELAEDSPLLIEMERTRYDIGEVNVRPGINPAHRIIKLVVANRDRNNPEKMRSFSYTAYNKMYFTLHFDTLGAHRKESDERARAATAEKEGSPAASGEGDGNVNAGAGLDSSVLEVMDFFETHHLFLMEFVSKRQYLYPGRNNEKVTASRVSGFRDPSFTLLATQLQSFSFYDETISITDRQYLNPISRGSTRKYLFILEDTLFTLNNDTLFVISFRPLRKKNFEGLMGILYINSNGYAVQNVTAEAAEEKGLFRIRIQQKYELVEGKQWFPSELNTDVIFQPDQLQANSVPVTLEGIGKSYLSDIDLEPELKKREFSAVELRIDDKAHKQSPSFWEDNRAVPLTLRDTNTYLFIDSIGEEAHFDRTLAVTEALASGYIPWKFLNIDYRSLFHYNEYEGFRIGLSAETNGRLSPWFSIGGKIGYGFRDRETKYGGNFRLNFDPAGRTYLGLAYDHDVQESAGLSFLRQPPITSSERYREYLIRNMDLTDKREAVLGSSFFPDLDLQLFFNTQSVQSTGGYYYIPPGATGSEAAGSGSFRFTETGLRFRLAFGEKFMETPRGNRIPVNSGYPVLQGNLALGTTLAGGQYRYARMAGRISRTFRTTSFGRTNVTIMGGLVEGSVPYPVLYNGHGSFEKFTVETRNSFATMRMNEFTSDRFAFLFLSQDFGKLLLRTRRFAPDIILVHNMGLGWLRNDEGHFGIPVRTMDKGYGESGLLINNILRQTFTGIGLGAFYRWGPYAFSRTIDNFAFKFTVSINII